MVSNIAINLRPRAKNQMFRVVHFGYILSQSSDTMIKKTVLSMTLTKNISENDYSITYFYYDCNRSKRDLQNNILQVYIIT